MAKVKREHRIAKIHMAVGLFIGMTRDAKIIAEKLKTSERNVKRWAKDAEWKIALESINYQGDRSFRVKKQGRDPQRDNPELFERVRKQYIANLKDSNTGWECARITAEALKSKGTEILPRRVWNWAKKYDWEGKG